MSVDPSKLLAPQTRYEQECIVLYIITVAGKTSEFAVNALGKFLHRTSDIGTLPFERIKDLWRVGALDAVLRECKLSPYGIRYKAFRHVSLFSRRDDLTKITPDEWSNVGGEKVGIGPKSSRYICMCLDPTNSRFAALDTHVLKWMRLKGYDVPKSTPPAGPKYNRIEQWFLDECDFRNRNPAEFDLEIWEAYKYGREIPK